MGNPVIWAIVVALLWVGRVAASGMQPAELPPPDFTAGQYIDSRGCVFLRGEGEEWRARLYRGEEMVCGYPPTLAKRPVGIEAAVALFGAPDHPPPKTPEDMLVEEVFPNLRAGERVGDHAPFRPLPDMGPEPFAAGPADFLQAEIAAQSAVRYAMAGARQPNRELCRLLGYDRPPPLDGSGSGSGSGSELISGSDRLGHDPSQGFCSGLAAAQVSRLAFARPARVSEHGAGGPVQSDNQVPERLTTQGAVDQPSPATRVERMGARINPSAPSADARRHRAQPAGARSKAATVTELKQEGVIPANARYIQVGRYENPQQLAQALRRLSALALPIWQEVAPSGANAATILAGPFDTRQAIVMALDRIRKAGFPDAFPR